MTDLLHRFRAIAAAFLLIAATAIPAFAGPFEDAVAKFANDDFSDSDEAVGIIATSGNPQAFAVITALQEGRLSADPDSKKVYLTSTDGKVTDAATGEAVAEVPASAAAVRLNNRLRRNIESALGGLTLMSPDPAKRIASAQSVFKSHETAMLPVIETALEKETNKTAKQAFTEARAAILLPRPRRSNPSRSSRAAAIRMRWRCSPACRPTRPSASRAARPAPSPRSTAGRRCGRSARTPGTDCRSARFSCSLPLASPSPSA